MIAQELITPEKAAEMLEHRSGIQRNISKAHVERLAKMMREGHWREHASGVICLDDRGELLDGQHRLQAVVDSGVSHRFLVDRGCSREDFKAMDDGLKRKTSQFINEGNAKTLASIATAVANLKMGAGCQMAISHSRVDRATVLETYEADIEGFAAARSWADAIFNLAGGGSRKAVGATLYVLSLVYGRRLVDAFIRHMVKDPTGNEALLISRLATFGARKSNEVTKSFGVVYYLFTCWASVTEPSRHAKIEKQTKSFEQLAKEYFNVN